MNATQTSRPAWFRSDAEIVRLLGNRLAHAAMRGESLPIAELVYNRMTSGK